MILPPLMMATETPGTRAASSCLGTKVSSGSSRSASAPSVAASSAGAVVDDELQPAIKAATNSALIVVSRRLRVERVDGVHRRGVTGHERRDRGHHQAVTLQRALALED